VSPHNLIFPVSIFTSGTTFGTGHIAVLVQGLPNPLHPIGSLRYLQLTVFVRPSIPRKILVRPVKWGTFTRMWELYSLYFLSHGLRLASCHGVTPVRPMRAVSAMIVNHRRRVSPYLSHTSPIKTQCFLLFLAVKLLHLPDRIHDTQSMHKRRLSLHRHRRRHKPTPRSRTSSPHGHALDLNVVWVYSC
jgi:hypothetical protein